MNRGLIIVLIILLSIIALVLTAGFVVLLNNNSFNINFNMDFAEGETKIVETKEASCDSISNLDIEIYSVDIEVKPSENENIKVEYYSNKEDDDRIIMSVEEGIFKVEEKEETEVRFGIINYTNKLVVYIPEEKYLGDYNIKTSSGDINSEIDMSSNKLNMATSSGDIKVETIGESNVAASSGDIKINDIKGNSNIATSSGDIWIQEAKGNANVKTRSGDLKLEKISGALDLKTTSGDILVGELNIEANSKIEATSGDVIIRNNACNCYIDTETTSGDSRINQSDRKSEIELKIKTTSGDISVN